jgi:predicted N-acyltransferase
MQRIKYKKDPLTGVYQSQPVLSQNGFVVAQHKDLHWFIVSYDTGDVFLKGSSINLSQLKRKIRSELKTLGVNFYDEVRSGRK